MVVEGKAAGNLVEVADGCSRTVRPEGQKAKRPEGRNGRKETKEWRKEEAGGKPGRSRGRLFADGKARRPKGQKAGRTKREKRNQKNGEKRKLVANLVEVADAEARGTAVGPLLAVGQGQARRQVQRQIVLHRQMAFQSLRLQRRRRRLHRVLQAPTTTTTTTTTSEQHRFDPVGLAVPRCQFTPAIRLSVVMYSDAK